MTAAPPAARPAAPSPVRLTALHTRAVFVEAVRVPIAVIGSLVFPALALLFFVVPMEEVAGDRVFATEATVGMAYFAVMTNCLFTFGVGVADDRDRPWDPYLRTLPVGAGPRMTARLLNGLAWSLLSLVPVLAVAALLTEARVTPGQFLLAAAMLAAGVLPFLFGGLCLGYLLSAKAALAVAQVVMFSMAFAGGLFLPPMMLPGWVDRFSVLLPSRAGRDLMAWATTEGTDLPGRAAVVALVWTVATLALAAWAYRRDEGRRYH